MVKNAAELEENLHPGPRLRADELHAVVWDAGRKLWADGHMGSPLQSAGQAVEEHIAIAASEGNLRGSRLVNAYLAPGVATPASPRLRRPTTSLSAETITNRKEGLFGLGKAVVQGVRNIVSHGSHGVNEQEALESLAAMSLLCRWIDDCTLVDDEAKA